MKPSPSPRLSILVAFLAAGLCFAVPAPAQTQPQTQPETPAETPVERKELPPPEIELISPGKAPREELRLTPTLNTPERLKMDMEMSMAMGMNGAPAMPMDMPTTSFTMSSTAIRQIDSETYEVLTVFRDVAADPNHTLAPMLNGPLGSMNGLKMTTISTTRGIVTSIKIEYPSGMDPTMKQQMESMEQSLTQMIAPFPKEPVGKGAKWKVTTRVEIGGIAMEMTSTFELLSNDASGYRLGVSIDQSAQPQNVASPQLPPGATMKLTKMTGTGSGESLFERTSFLPVTAKSTADNSIKMTVDMQGTTMDMTNDTSMTMTMTMERRKPNAKP